LDALLGRLTLEQKVGQLLMVGFAGTEVDDEAKSLLQGPGVGGVCLFKRNILSAEQVKRLNAALRALVGTGIPPFLALDQEGGNVVRVQDGVPVLPSNMALGATGSPDLAYAAGQAQAYGLRRLGFNMNFAPVLDVNLNPRNPVIGIRSFGDSPADVAELGEAFVRGQQDGGLATVAKHFPGHGNTAADSHRALPVMHETPEELRAQLLPFESAIQAGLDGLMTAHVAVPNVSGDDLPATLSPRLLGGILRDELEYQGLVLTDELEMEAIAQRFGVGRAAVRAISAGADMVLVPWRPKRKAEARAALLEAVRTGELTAARVDESVRRILTLKLRRGLFEAAPDLETSPEFDDVPAQIARASVTLLRAERGHFPLRHGARLGVVSSERALVEALRTHFPQTEGLVVPAYPAPAVREALQAQVRAMAARVDTMVVGVTNTHHLELVQAAARPGKRVAVVIQGLPYLAEQVPLAGTVLAVYSYRPSAVRAAADALAGTVGTPGRLPVTLSRMPRGFGLTQDDP
jgi:beta-N-acetylhexosaminidase